MESKLPPPPLAAARSGSATHGHTVQSKLPMPVSRIRSRFHSSDEAEQPTHSSKEQLSYYPASVSSSASSSPDMAAVVNGAAVIMAVPPRLELHELSHGLGAEKGAVDGANTVGMKNVHEEGECNVKSHQQLQQPQQQSRSGIPVAGMKSVHFRSLTTPGTTHLQTTSTTEKDMGKQVPSRIGRYEPKKKPLPPTIDTHWSAEAVPEADTNGVDHSGAILRPQTTDPISPRRASPISGICAPISSENAVVPPPMTPPVVRVPHVHANGNAHSEADPQKMPVSPPMVQRLKKSVEPPKTPSGSPAFESFNDDDESKLSASQRVRMGLSALMIQGNGLGNGATETIRRKSHEGGAERNQNEGVAAPMSCPRLSQAGGEQQFSALRETRHIQQQQQRRGSNSIASKLLPSRMCLNNLIEYVRELHQSAASLRLQLEQTKQNAENELLASRQKASSLQESMQRVEVEHELARTRIKEQEQLIHDLHAQVSDLQQQIQGMRTNQSASSFCEGETLISNGSAMWTEQQSEQRAIAGGGEVLDHREVSENDACINHEHGNTEIDGMQGNVQSQPITSSQECVVSSRLAKSLWEPWSSGSNSPLATATPPMFTIAPSNLDLMPSSPQLTPETASSSTSVNQAHVLKSIVSPGKVIRGRASEENGSAVPLQSPVSATTEEQVGAAFNLTAPPIFTLGTVSASDIASKNDRRMDGAIADSDENASLSALTEVDEQQQNASTETPSPRESITPVKMMHPVEPCQPHDDMSNNESSATTAVTHPKLFHPQAHSKSPVPKATPESTAASLKKLLTDFFSEFDKGKMGMAEVYGKRYVGHEDRLFAELTRRYGKEKVTALQRRYEESLVLGDVDTSQHPQDLHEVEAFQPQDHQSELPTVHTIPVPPMQYPHDVAAEDMIPVQQGQTKQWPLVNSSPLKSGEAPTQKVSPTGKTLPIADFRDPGFSQVLSCIDEDSGIETDASSSTSTSAAPPLLATAGSESSYFGSTSQSSVQPPPVSPQRVLPQRRPTPRFPVDGAITLKTDAPPLPMRDSSQPYIGGTKSSPIRRQGEPSTGHPPMFTNFSGESDEKKPAASISSLASSESVGVEKTAVVSKPHAVEQEITLESLLKELYKKHQPDKLRNVDQVAKEFAGRERELVRLLRVKYGALSVKRLEDNLSALEKANNQATPITTKRFQASTKKRGFISAFLTCGVLVSFTALTLGGAGLVLLDSRGCHNQRYASPCVAAGNTAACYKLTLDLEVFEIAKIQDYTAQSYPVKCFCSEWVEREDALLSRYSGTNVVNLAKMLPFSRAAVDAYLINTPVREYYTQYAKPLIEISRDYGSVIQSALVDVGEEISSQFTELRDRMLPSVAGVDEPSPSKVDFNKGNGSVASTLTKIAQASKSLLNNVQEETAAVVESEGERQVRDRSDVVADAEHGSDSEINSEDERQPVVMDSAIVEVEVRQDGVDISYPETQEALNFAVEEAKSAGGASTSESNPSYAMTHATSVRDGDETTHGVDAGESSEVSELRNDEFTAQMTIAPVNEEKPGTIGESDRMEPVIAESTQKVDQDPATAIVEDVVTVGALEESVNAEIVDGDLAMKEESAEPTASAELVSDADVEESNSYQPVDEDEDDKSHIESAVDETRVLLTASENGELASISRPSDEPSDSSSVDDNREAFVKFDEAAATAHSDEVHGVAETDDSVAQADAEEVEASSDDLDGAIADEAKGFLESRPSVDSANPNPAEAGEKLSTEAVSSPPSEEESLPTHGDFPAENLVDKEAFADDDQEDDDDGENFDFGIDPWELLGMAERAAAAQLHTLEKAYV